MKNKNLLLLGLTSILSISLYFFNLSSTQKKLPLTQNTKKLNTPKTPTLSKTKGKSPNIKTNKALPNSKFPVYSSNQNFQISIDQEIVKLEIKIRKSIKNDKDISLEKSQLFALKTLKAFKYLGNDKLNRPQFRLKDQLILNNKLQPTNKKDPLNGPRTIRSPTTSNIFNIGPIDFTMALTPKKDQFDKRIGLYLNQTTLRNTFLDSMTSAMDKMNLVTNDPRKIHYKNKQMMREIFRDALGRPHLYKTKRSKLKTLTDLEFSIYAQSIKSKISAKFGLISGAIGGIASNQILKFSQSAVLIIGFEAIKGLSFDSLFMAIAVNLGIKQIYDLSSYYQYLQKENIIAISQGKKLNLQEVNDNYNIDDIYNSELFQREMQKSWIFGHFTMTIKEFYRDNKLNSKFFEGLALSAFSWLGTPSVIPIFFAMTRLLNNMISGKTITAILNMTGMSLKIFPSWLVDFIKMGPWKLITLPIDILTHSASMFALIHMRLHGASLIFQNVYPHPATLIHLSINQKFDKIQNFKKASSHHFLRLCSYIASTGKINREIEDENERMLYLSKNQAFINQFKECISMNYMLKKGHKLLSRGLERKYKRKISKIIKRPELILDDTTISKELIKIYKSYPAHYKLLWLTALRGIVKKPAQIMRFNAMKNTFILGSSEQKWWKEYFRYHIYELKSFEDLRRMHLMISEISKHKTETYSNTFEKFYSKHLRKGKDIKVILQKSQLKGEENFVSIFWREVLSLKESIIFSFSSFTQGPGNFAFRRTIENELLNP